MNSYTEYYAFNGVAVVVEPYDMDEQVDVSTIMPEHDTGIVPADETHFLVLLPGTNREGWWATEDKFWKYADPLSPAAIERAEQRGEA